MAVAIEEMIVNIFKFGGKGVNYVDLSIRLIDDKLNICFTDDGIPFDPTNIRMLTNRFLRCMAYRS